MYKDYDSFHPNDLRGASHVAIIPDGGRRWAMCNGYSNYDAYVLMCKRVYELLQLNYNYGVNTISVYFSSSQNFRRSADEVDAFCRAEAEFISSYSKEIYELYNANIIIVGQGKNIPDYFKKAMRDILPFNEKFTRKVYLCVDYNPHYELERAVLKAKENGGIYVNYLDIIEPVSLVVRTGNACVMSNFLMPQVGFARLFFFKELFNDFTDEQMKKVLDDYSSYTLRYGT